jgi:mono/diheme cytochrome c family protein
MKQINKPLWFLVSAYLLIAGVAWAQEAADYFRQNCASCHTIGGGRLTGPDLKNVTSRKDPEWLVRFVTNPQAALDQGDAYAVKLQQEARGVVMPTVSGISRSRVEALLSLIEAESKLEKSQFAGLQITDRPFTDEEIELGRQLFRGARRLANGGPPCISCHTMRDVAALGGGRLGPDLTRAFERMEDRRNMAAWLTAPATPVMQPVFKRHSLGPEEILPLVALFEHAAREGGQDESAAPLTFLLMGLGGTVAALVILDSVWNGRFRSVRRALVFNATHRGEA